METNITVETAKDSTILAYGTVQHDHRKRLIIALIILLSSCLAGIVIWFGLRQNLPVGPTTIFIITQPSKTQGQLPESIRTHLPLPWQTALTGSSHWPIVLGGGLGANGWEWFAIMPRWRKNAELPSTSAGLARIIYHQTPLSTPQNTFRYRDALKAWLRTPFDQARGHFELSDVSTSSSAVSFTYRNGIIKTSLSFENQVTSFNPRDADLSINLSSLVNPIHTELLNELPIPHFIKLPSLEEGHFVLQEGGWPTMVQIVNKTSFSLEETRQILAGFGVAAKRVIQLADGTLATEITTSLKDFSQPIHIDENHELSIEDREIRYGSSTQPLPTLPAACPNASIVARISPFALSKMAESLGLLFEKSTLTGWQVARDRQGQMIMCKE